ncbi:phage tail tape measure protein [Veillonella sp.]|uniref:phage tail tape measure protein n=1 Tax=Veillonella sp. TaxID=1926307 RepID=UPI0025FAB5F4|nr:phage tail tape measure protein [Veillonella sp.]
MEVIDVMMRLVDGVTAPLRAINSQLSMTAKQQNAAGRNVQRLGKDISGVGEALTPVAAGIVAMGAMGAKAFVGFDSVVTAAAAKAGATAEEMEQMRSTASRLGADFPISATEAAQGMDNLAAAGYNAKEIMAMMPSVITSSVAAGEDLALTSEVVSNALNVWGLKQGDIAANTVRVSDVIQQANNMSSLSLNDFGVAMQYAGAPAATLGIQIEDLSAAMAIMRNNGIAASTVGTTLRSTLSRLAAPPKAAAEALSQLGIQVKDSQGNFIGLENVIGQLRTAMGGLADTEQVAMAKAISGEEGYSGLLALLKTSPEAYREMTEAMYNAAGSSQAQFEIMKNTVKGSIDDMMGSIESFAINMGDVLRPQIQAAAAAIAWFADSLNALTPEQKLLLGNIAIGIVAFTGFTLVLGKVITMGGTLMRTWASVRIVMAGGTVSNKLLQYSVQGLMKSYGGLTTVFNVVKSSAFSAFTFMRGLTWSGIIKSALGGIRGINVGGLFSGLLGGMRAGIGNVFQGIFGALKGFNLSSISSGAFRAFTMIARGIRMVAMAGRALFLSPIGIAIMAIAGAAYILYQNWDKVGPFFIQMWGIISDAFNRAYTTLQPAFNALITAVQPIINLLADLFNQAAQGQGPLAILFGAIAAVSQILGAGLVGAIMVVINIFTNQLVMVIDVVASVMGAVIGVLAGVINFIVAVFVGDWAGAWQAVVSIFDSIFGGITGICEGVLNGIKGAINAIIDGINGISVDVPSWVPGIGGSKFGPLGIPRLYTGTNNWMGGPAMIHDKGAEIVNLPTGTQVIPHDQSLTSAYNQGKRSGGGGPAITINFYGTTITSGGDIKELARKVAAAIYYEMQKAAINQNEGAV